MKRQRGKGKSGFMVFALAAAAIVLWFAGAFYKHIKVENQGMQTRIAFENEEIIVKSLRQKIKEHFGEIVITFRADGKYLDDMEKIVSGWMTCALMPTGVSDEGDYMRYQLGGYTYNCKYKNGWRDYSYTIKIKPRYYLTMGQENEVTMKVREILEELQIEEKKTKYEKLKAIYDYLYKNVGYDIIHKDNENYHMNATAYGALIYKRASCQGYSVALNRLLLEAGVDNRVITGYAQKDEKTEFHAWNLVSIQNNLYYNLDLTWNKQLESNEFFLKGEAAFSSHKRDAEFTSTYFKAEYPVSETDYAENQQALFSDGI